MKRFKLSQGEFENFTPLEAEHWMLFDGTPSSEGVTDPVKGPCGYQRGCFRRMA